MKTYKDLQEICAVLDKYAPNENFCYGVEHDMIYFYNVSTTGISEDDKLKLDKLGVYVDENEDEISMGV